MTKKKKGLKNKRLQPSSSAMIICKFTNWQLLFLGRRVKENDAK